MIELIYEFLDETNNSIICTGTHHISTQEEPIRTKFLAYVDESVENNGNLCVLAVNKQFVCKLFRLEIFFDKGIGLWFDYEILATFHTVASCRGYTEANYYNAPRIEVLDNELQVQIQFGCKEEPDRIDEFLIPLAPIRELLQAEVEWYT